MEEAWIKLLAIPDSSTTIKKKKTIKINIDPYVNACNRPVLASKSDYATLCDSEQLIISIVNTYSCIWN